MIYTEYRSLTDNELVQLALNTKKRSDLETELALRLMRSQDRNKFRTTEQERADYAGRPD